MALRSPGATVGLLALCQALLLTNNAIIVSLNGIVGAALTADPAFATLPLTAYVVGTALATMPASLWMKRVGRRGGFMTGAMIGVVGSSLCALAVARASFWLLCAGTLLIGSYNAFGQYYRFAAAESVSEERRGTAISLVLAGGILGAFLGPESSKITKDLLPTAYLGAYVSLALFQCLALCVQSLVRFAEPRAAGAAMHEARPLREIVRQPAFVVAVLSAVIGYGVMNFLMTATPLAMLAHHHHFEDTAFVIEWHIVGMFAPSFATGPLVKRFGALAVIRAGGLVMLASVATAATSTGLLGFWTALVLLGIGWNFLYVGGTTLLTETYRPSERAKTQGLNDSLVFGTMAMTSLLSGVMLHSLGWQAMTVWMLPFVLVVLAAATWLAVRRRTVRRAA